MRNVATVVLFGLAGACLASEANADQLGAQPAMRVHHARPIAVKDDTVASSGPLKAMSDLTALATMPIQAMTSWVSAGIGGKVESRTDGASVRGASPAAAAVPNSWQLSITPNAARASLVGLAPPAER